MPFRVSACVIKDWQIRTTFARVCSYNEVKYVIVSFACLFVVVFVLFCFVFVGGAS